MRKVSLAFALTAGLVLLLPLTASAGQPTSETFHSEGIDLPAEDCGSFTALLSYNHDETITTYSDKSGTPVREQIAFNFTGTLRNSATGRTAYERGNYTITVDLANGEARTVGLELLIRVPGLGVATLELGQVVFENGSITHDEAPQILDGDSFICSLLS